MEGKKLSIKVRAVILNNGKLLVVKHSSTNFLALPGGHLEWGEDIKECLSREIIEELGVKPEIGKLLYINSFINKETHYIEFFFEVKNGEEFVNLENLAPSHAFELIDKIWISPTDDMDILPKSFKEYFKKGEVISDEIKFIS